MWAQTRKQGEECTLERRDLLHVNHVCPPEGAVRELLCDCVQLTVNPCSTLPSCAVTTAQTVHAVTPRTLGAAFVGPDLRFPDSLKQ